MPSMSVTRLAEVPRCSWKVEMDRLKEVNSVVQVRRVPSSRDL